MMMRVLPACFAMAMLWSASAGSVVAQKPTPAELIAIDTEFAAKKKDYDTDYLGAIAELQKTRLTGLRALAKRAQDGGDKAAATSLRNMIKAGELEVASLERPDKVGPNADAVRLQKSLSGTAWQWDSETVMRFNPSGNVEEPGWTGHGLVTSWQAIDRRTAMLYIESGRTNDRYAILSFSPNLDSCGGYGFDGLPFKKPLPRVK